MFYGIGAACVTEGLLFGQPVLLDAVQQTCYSEPLSKIASWIRTSAAGVIAGAALTKADRSRFLSVLDTEVQKALRTAARNA